MILPVLLLRGLTQGGAFPSHAFDATHEVGHRPLPMLHGRGRITSKTQRRQSPQQKLGGLSLPTKQINFITLPDRAITMGSLAFIAGAVDAVCYTKYRCYTNMMTGNSIIAGQALAVACWAKLAFVASLLLNYVLGVATFRLLNFWLGSRKWAVTAPLVLLVNLAADALSLHFASHWHLTLLALGAGLANAFSSTGPEAVTNMVTGHWNCLANFSVDFVCGRNPDSKRKRAAKRSLGITLALVLGVVTSQTLLQRGISPRFWWFGAAYAIIFIWHDIALQGMLRTKVSSAMATQGAK